MKPTTQTSTILAALAVFVGLPVLFYALGEAPRRSVLKKVISIATLLAFAAMLGHVWIPPFVQDGF